MVGTIRKNVIVKLILKLISFNLFLCVVFTTLVGNDEELFLRGNKYYAQKNYTSALQTYELINKKGRAVLYNMGNCAFHQGDYSYALVYWNRAQRGATAQEYARIERNKKIAFIQLGKEPDLSWWHSIVHLVSTHSLPVTLFILQLIFLLLWWLFMFALSKKQTGIKKVMQRCVSVMTFMCASLLSVHYIQHNTHQAIIVKKEARLLNGPDKSFHVVCPLNYAQNVSVKESREGWHKIQYAGMIGWVEADVIQII